MSDKESDLSLRAGHRERLRQNFLAGNLAKYETLELLLSYAIPRRDVRPLARMLYKRFGGMFQILSAEIEDLCAVRGMGRNTAIFLKTVQKIMLDGYQDDFTDPTILHTKEQFRNYCKLLLGGKHVEEMHVLYLDEDGRLIEDQLHSTGTYDQASLYGIEVIKHAISVGAKSVILVHNHPHRETSFSTQDVEVTNELRKQLKAVNINLFDHCVVSGYMFYSMNEMKFLN